MNLTRVFELAKRASERSDHEIFRLGAVIFNKNRILSVGFNHKFKTHPIIQTLGGDFHKTLHAEIHAIIQVKNKAILRGSSIFVYRSNKDGFLAIAKPCPCCQKIIKHYGIKDIIYTNCGRIDYEL